MVFGVVAAVEDRTEDLPGAGRVAQRMADSVAAVLLARTAGVEHGGEAVHEKYVNVRNHFFYASMKMKGNVASPSVSKTPWALIFFSMGWLCF
jgi:hypothetical protein